MHTESMLVLIPADRKIVHPRHVAMHFDHVYAACHSRRSSATAKAINRQVVRTHMRDYDDYDDDDDDDMSSRHNYVTVLRRIGLRHAPIVYPAPYTSLMMHHVRCIIRFLSALQNRSLAESHVTSGSPRTRKRITNGDCPIKTTLSMVSR
jgi:hypothetical protein